MAASQFVKLEDFECHFQDLNFTLQVKALCSRAMFVSGLINISGILLDIMKRGQRMYVLCYSTINGLGLCGPFGMPFLKSGLHSVFDWHAEQRS